MKINWKKVFKIVIGFVIGIVAILFIRKTLKVIVGRVDIPQKFKPVEGDKRKIEVIKNNGSSLIVELPKNLKYKDIKAVGINETENAIIMESKHEENPFATSNPINGNSAFDRIHRDRITRDLHND